MDKEKLQEKMRLIKEEGKRMRQEMQHQTVGYVIAALGIIVGLAWNDAVKSLIEYFFPLTENSLRAKFIYALILTLILVFASSYLARFFAKKNDPPKQNS